jgi:LysM repeat protein
VAPTSLTTKDVVASKSKHKSKLQSASKKAITHHKVQQGETLISIASTHHTTVAALKRDNGNLATLRPGMVLLIRDSR